MGAIYKKTLNLQAVEVNYKTAADTLNDLANGAIDYMLVDNVFAMAQVRENRAARARRFDGRAACRPIRTCRP